MLKDNEQLVVSPQGKKVIVIKTMTDVRDKLINYSAELEAGIINKETAMVQCGLHRGIISSVLSELAYNKQMGRKKPIPFME